MADVKPQVPLREQPIRWVQDAVGVKPGEGVIHLYIAGNDPTTIGINIRHVEMPIVAAKGLRDALTDATLEADTSRHGSS